MTNDFKCGTGMLSKEAQAEVDRKVEAALAEHAAGAELGPMARATVASAPDLMRELTEQFIARRDLNSRVRLRLRMKAVLDLISVDTDYPPVPALDPSRERGPAAVPMALGNAAAMERTLERELEPQPIAAIPGAEQARDNDIVLGG